MRSLRLLLCLLLLLPVSLAGGVAGAGGDHQGEVFYLCYHDRAGSRYELWHGCKARDDDSTYKTPILIRNGRRIAPNRMHIYLRNGTSRVPEVFPNGLRWQAGRPEATSRQRGWEKRYFWQCGDTSASRHYPTPPDCPRASSGEGEHALTLIVKFPQCWDGDRLRYPRRNRYCPSNTTVVPRIEVHVQYTIEDGASGAPLRLSTGSIYGIHARFKEDWVMSVLNRYIRDCIAQGISCHVRSDGEIS
jgi:hypothetical protein